MTEALTGYVIWRHVLSPDRGADIPINEAGYKAIADANEVRLEIANMEEKFFVFCENYRELEEFVFSTNLKNMLYHDSNVTYLYKIGAEFSRRVLSMLSSSKLYVDTVVTHARKISGGRLTKEDINKVLSDTYDKSFSYRAAEAIRNHAQHDAFPVKSASYGATLDESGKSYEFRSEFFFDIEKLGNHKKYKAKTLAEIRDMGGKIELLSIIREYFSDICEIHLTLRGMFSPYEKVSSRTINEARDSWKKFNSTDDLLGVVAGKLLEGIIDESAPLIHLSLQTDEYRKYLASQTVSLRSIRTKKVVW